MMLLLSATGKLWVGRTGGATIWPVKAPAVVIRTSDSNTRLFFQIWVSRLWNDEPGFVDWGQCWDNQGHTKTCVDLRLKILMRIELPKVPRLFNWTGSADPSSTWCNVIQRELGSAFDLGSAEPRSWTKLVQRALKACTTPVNPKLTMHVWKTAVHYLTKSHIIWHLLYLLNSRRCHLVYMRSWLVENSQAC